VEDDQRTRVLEGVVEIMSERGAGAGAVTVAEILRRADISEASYARLFGDREGALLAAFDLGVERAMGHVRDPFEAESRWLDAVKAGLAGFLRFLEAEPAFGRLLVIYAMGGGEKVLRRRLEVLGSLAAIVDRGRQEGAATRHPPAELVAEGVLGAMLAILQKELMAERSRAPIELFGPLISIIVLPYLGTSIARRELTRPAPKPRRRAALVEAELGIDAEAPIAPTYRTRRVLGAIRDYPGASNREVAERAGIVDQGQISKLLARLEARGMIEKVGTRRARGAPNSWSLTARGERALER
jgi:AcrR family transcriptional regulator